jgi:hypothetical protein
VNWPKQSERNSPVAHKAASTTAAQMTEIYVALRGLTVPLRSPYVRLLTNLTEDLASVGEVAPLLFPVPYVLKADVKAGEANYNKACRPTF